MINPKTFKNNTIPRSSIAQWGQEGVIIISILFSFFLFSCSSRQPNSISLHGEWTVILDSLDQGEKEQWYTRQIKGVLVNLPGTLAENELGVPHSLTPEISKKTMFHLTRSHYYTGKAWYQRKVNIPGNIVNGRSVLELERVLWQSKVWINGSMVGTDSSLSTAHRFEINDFLVEGENTVTIMVDNSFIEPGISFEHERYPAPISVGFSHAYSNHTQGKWNGIIGKISLTKLEPEAIRELAVYPGLKNKKLTINAFFYGDIIDDQAFNWAISQNGKMLESGETPGKVNGKAVTATIPLPGEIEVWDEHNPNTYNLTFGKKNSSENFTTSFGLRDVKADGTTLMLNDKRIFLRGNLDCAVYPIKGRVDMTEAEWLMRLKVVKSYGFNHIRFHSWCPPKAAFEVADQLGMYLQAELPHWSLTVGKDKEALNFLEKEADRILKEYGNHPSFVLMSMGNELEGDMSWLNSQVERLKVKDGRRLYTTTTFSFQKGVGTLPQPEDEFFITQWTDKGWVRGQGYFNDFPPDFSGDYSNRIDHIDKPIVAHEIGQYAIFPDLNEIEKYSGVAQPVNLQAIKNDLEKKGMLDLAPKFAKASGQLASILYKADIERNLKTPGYDGFQLLQLQDYPGHGTALIGMLDVFWESKGIIDSMSFRRFNSPVVPLLRFGKVSYQSSETFNAAVQVANFLEPIENYKINWSIKDGGEEIENGVITGTRIPYGNTDTLGFIQVDLKTDFAKELTVSLEIEGTEYANDWSIWVFPKVGIPGSDVIYTQSPKEARKLLSEGKKVLFNPPANKAIGEPNRFGSIFWGQLLFKQVSNMGLLIDPDHPAFSNFPTNYHSDWQWWDLCTNSRIITLDELDVDPVVRVIDDFLTNRNLGLIFEAKVGNGKLLFSSIDLGKDLENRIEAKQMRISLVNYMESSEFEPKKNLTFENILTAIKNE
ncbi:glycoside hydrolase family 2 [Fulvivirga sp. M361]|uniref:sugar-binding domain-containing protein n=1 Tax=Fulvivirga sp. M361 TaxID=2594266 RepID=UPI00117B31C1|nr:sugar-binding domain-containing protein [Fulvivirga sp. M361]TRX50246.1 glycoside hydrolase family 2 [Fulvivirga sp. M361]